MKCVYSFTFLCSLFLSQYRVYQAYNELCGFSIRDIVAIMQVEGIICEVVKEAVEMKVERQYSFN